jgi:hypothetical protein
MRPLFTIHAGEFLVGQYIESQIPGRNVWVPTKDTGVDLLVTNTANTKAVTLQVKFSRDFLPSSKLDPDVSRQLGSQSWFKVDKEKLSNPTAACWVFVLVDFEKRANDFLLIEPKELLDRLEAIDEREKLPPSSRPYQVYFCVTRQKPPKAWLTRGLPPSSYAEIANGTYADERRDVTSHLNDWAAIKAI